MATLTTPEAVNHDPKIATDSVPVGNLENTQTVATAPQPQASASPPWLFSPDFAKTAPSWFLAVVGLIYASGFVVVTNFLESYGLRDIGADLWKARYINVGFLCSVFPMAVAITTLLLVQMIRARQKLNPRRFLWIRISNAVILYGSLQLAFYFFVMFSRRTSADELHATGFAQLRTILLLVLFGPALYLISEAFLKNPPPNWKFPLWFGEAIGAGGRILLDVLILVVFVRFAREYSPMLKEMARTRIFPLSSFVLFVAFLVVGPALMRWYSGAVHGRPNPTMAVLNGCLVLPVAYLALMAFAVAVFPYIPSTRGGGDYTTSPFVIVKLKPDGAIDKALALKVDGDKESGFVTRPSILIDETSATIFIADPFDAGGPAEWRKSQGKRPDVIAVPKQSIEMIRYLSLESMKSVHAP